MSFSYEIKEQEGVIIIYLEGRILDRSEADKMMEEVDVLMDDGKNNFILDLSKIDYMSSAGLNVMISLLTQSRNRYGELVVCEVPDKVSRLLVTSKLQNIFTITDTQAEALKKVKK